MANGKGLFKLLIAVPTFETIDPEVFKAIYNLYIPSIISKTDFEFVRGYDCARARNEICQKALDGNYDYVLTIDSDVVVPEHTLASFFDKNPGDVLLGVYPRKDGSHKTEIFSFSDANYTEANRYGMNDLKKMADIHESYRMKVKGGGFGCALIDVDLLKKLNKPWFLYVTYPNGAALSEDLYFCEKVGNSGGSIYVDTRVFCGHVAKHTVYD